MSPRPESTPHSEFHPALERARAGQTSEAVLLIERLLAPKGAASARATPAALALAEVARHAERAHDLPAAERALALALELRPRFADVQYQYACVLLLRQRRYEARRALDAALALNPRYVAARVELALLDARDGMVGEALGALRALSFDGSVEDSRAFQLGIKSLEHADWDQADTLLRRALHLADSDLRDRLERFHAFMRQDDPRRAAETLREVLPQHEGYPDLHYLLGCAELHLGHHDDAVASLARALELNPDFLEARFQFALALDAAGMTPAAFEQASLVLQQDPKNVEARDFVAARSRRPTRRVA